MSAEKNLSAITFVQTTPDRHRSSKVALHNLKTFKMKKFIISNAGTTNGRHWGIVTQAVEGTNLVASCVLTFTKPAKAGDKLEIPEALAATMKFRL